MSAGMKVVPELLLDKMGEISGSNVFPAPPWSPRPSGVRDVTVVSAQATRMIGKPGEREGFVVGMTFRYDGPAPPTVGVFISPGDDTLQVRGSLLMLVHKESGKPLEQVYAEGLADPKMFVARHWQIVEPNVGSLRSSTWSETDMTWRGIASLARLVLPRLFEAVLARPEGDPLPEPITS